MGLQSCTSNSVCHRSLQVGVGDRADSWDQCMALGRMRVEGRGAVSAWDLAGFCPYV